MIKSLIKISLIISIFDLYLSLPSFAMDELNLDLGNPIEKLCKTPANNFKRSHIKLNNITSDRKFFDGDADFTQSISYKLLSAIYDMTFTQHPKESEIVHTIEYSYPNNKKIRGQYEIDKFMNNIVEGIKVIKRKDTNGKWYICFDDSNTIYNIHKSYNISVYRDNKLLLDRLTAHIKQKEDEKEN